jgi:hypothetical protein
MNNINEPTINEKEDEIRPEHLLKISNKKAPIERSRL